MENLFKVENPCFIHERGESAEKIDIKSIIKISIKFFVLYCIAQILVSIVFNIFIQNLYPNASLEDIANTSSWLYKETPIVLLNMIMVFFTAMILLLFYKKCYNKLFNIGFTKKKIFFEYLKGYLLGFVVFSICILLAVFLGVIKFNGISSTMSPIILAFFLAFLLQGMGEEIMCRGIVLTECAKNNSIWVAMILNSVLFMLMHCINSGINILGNINIFLIGIVFSLLIVKRGNIWIAGAFHSIWNFVQGNFYGINVSGFVVPSIFSTSANGSSLLNGGAFGMEGSIITTVVMLILIFILLKLKPQKIEE